MVLESLNSETPNIKDLSLEPSKPENKKDYQVELDEYWDWTEERDTINARLEKKSNSESNDFTRGELVELADILTIFPERRNQLILDNEPFSNQIYTSLKPSITENTPTVSDATAEEIMALKTLYPKKFNADINDPKFTAALSIYIDRETILRWKEEWLLDLREYESYDLKFNTDSLNDLLEATCLHKFILPNNQEVQETIKLEDSDWNIIIQIFNLYREKFDITYFTNITKYIRIIDESRFKQLNISSEEIQKIHKEMLKMIKNDNEFQLELNQVLDLTADYAIITADKVVVDEMGIHCLDKSQNQEDQPPKIPLQRSF